MGNELLFLSLFSSSAMLLWAAAAVIPIILHLLSRRYRQEVPWANMRFLRAAYEKSSRKFRFWQWVLLAVRVACLLLFALAIADPVSPSLNSERENRANRLEVIVIDTSMSMGTAQRQSNLVASVASLLESSQPGDGFLVAEMSALSNFLFDEISFDRQRTLQCVKDLRVTDTSADVVRTLDQIRETLTRLERQSLWSGEVRVTFFTDLQESSWTQAPEEPDLSLSPSIEICDVANDGLLQLCVHSIELVDGWAVSDKELTLRSKIKTTPFNESKEVLAHLKIDGVVDQSRRLSLDEREVFVDWETVLPEGTHFVGVEVEGDDLSLVSRRFRVFDVTTEVNSLCFGSKEDTRFIATALASGTDGLLSIANQSSKLAQVNLEEIEFLVICNPKKVSISERAKLKRFISAGGSVIMWLGDQALVESINTTFGKASGFGIGQLVGVSEEGQYLIDPLLYRHPIAAAFKSHPYSGLLTTPIFRYWRLDRFDDPSVEEVFGINEGGPLLIMKKFNSGGTLFVFTSSPTPRAKDGNSWNAMALWPSFIPVVQEVLTYANNQSNQSNGFTAGKGFTLSMSSKNEARVFRVICDNEVIHELEGSNAGNVLDVPPLMFAGVYEVKADNVTLHTFAVNSPVGESDVNKIRLDLLPARYQVVSIGVSNPEEKTSVDLLQSVGKPQGRLFHWFLVCAVGCLVAEAVVSLIMRTRFA